MRLYPKTKHLELIEALIKPQLMIKAKSLKQSQIKCAMLSALFSANLSELVDAGYHQHIEEVISTDPIVSNRKQMA